MIVHVIGIHGGETYGRAARDALAHAQVVLASARHVAFVPLADHQEWIELAGPLGPLLERIDAARAAGRRVAVLSSGDPGFFGIVRVLAERFGPDALDIHPAPSSIALACARIGQTWDDVVVVSAHGRPLAAALATVLEHPRVAVLTAPTQPPELLGRSLREAHAADRQVTVASRLGEPGEHIVRTNLAGLAEGAFDPMSVVLLIDAHAQRTSPSLAWGLPESAFEHRAGLITKAEVRAVALGKLALPARGVLWDVGAGSGSVAIECARLAPGLRVFAIERATADAERIEHNAQHHGVRLTVVQGEAPGALEDLPRPDRVFVGGGGLDVLQRCLELLAPDGVIVATHVLVERAAAAWRLLGNTTQISIARGSAIADGFRLQAENPIFVSWGPERP